MKKDEIKELLSQPGEASKFAQEVAVNTYCDVSPFEVECILRSLNMIDNHGNPTEYATEYGLPGYNQPLLNLIGEAAEARMAMTDNMDLTIIAKWLKNKDRSDRGMRLAVKASQENVDGYKLSYLIAMNRILALLNY